MIEQDYILLTSKPTEDDYFRAKLLNADFRVHSENDVILFDLIDMDKNIPFNIIYFPKDEIDEDAFSLTNIQYKHGMKVEKSHGETKSILGYRIESLYMRRSWMEQNCPDLLEYCENNKDILTK